ncbi:MAG: lipocalin-like domain-containing protein [Thermoplasmata archaeon]
MPDSVVGIWALVSVEFRSESGQTIQPFGPNPAGLMVISADGYFSLQVMDPRRPSFPSGDVFGSTLVEKAGAMQGYSAYSGTWEHRGDRLLIHIKTSLFPNWVGQDEERPYVLIGDRLNMKTKSVLAGGRQVAAEVIWSRVSKLK